MRKTKRLIAAALAAGGLVGISFATPDGTRTLCVEPGGLSPAAAVETMRKAKADGYRGAWEIRVASGIHEMGETLVLRPGDSGTPEAPVTWIGEGDAVLCGGRTLRGWAARPDGLWEAPVPVVNGRTPVFFESLYANGRRLARTSLFGDEHPMIDAWTETAVTNADGSVSWMESVRLDDPRLDALAGLPAEELASVRFGVIAKWAFGAYSVVGYDAKARTVTVRLREKVKSWIPWNHRNAEFGRVMVTVENVRAGLVRPGSWFYDRPAGKVLYRPLPGEEIAAFRPTAPTAQLVSLVRFAGDVDRGAFVHDIAFSNLTFACTRTDGERLPFGLVQQYHHQGARNAGGAIAGEGVHRVTFDGCRVRETENYGLMFGRGCVSNRIVNCRFTNLGAGGLWIGDKRPGPTWLGKPMPRDAKAKHFPAVTKEVHFTGNPASAFNVIDNCEVSECGRVNPEACGIVLTHVSDSSVTHCDIHDLYYTGVSVGWTWGFLGSVAQRNTIAFNRIWDIGKGVMSDMGGVYTLGSSFGTCVSNNVIHAVHSHSYGGWGLYNDEGSEGIVLENNLVYDTTSASYHQNYGRDNVVRNNILADSREAQLALTCAPACHSVTFERNVVHCPAEQEWPVFCPPVVYQNCTYADVGWSSNVFWSASGCVEVGRRRTDAWMVGPDFETRVEPTPPLRCAEPSGFVCDPKFVDAAKRDYRLQLDSPALRYGFRPWDFSLSGMRRKQ